MRAAILRGLPAGTALPYAGSRPFTIEELDTPHPRAGETGVEIIYSSPCHSDLSVVNGSRPRPLPMALGHEAVGRVARLGEGVEHLRVGAKVVLVFVPGCGDCRAAASNAAGDLLHGPALRRGPRGERINHHPGVSAFASHAVVAAESLVPIDEDVPDEVAAMFGCAVLTGNGAIRHTARLGAGQSVIVHGLGAVGLAVAMGAVLQGAGSIIAIDPNTDNHALALGHRRRHLRGSRRPGRRGHRRRGRRRGRGLRLRGGDRPGAGCADPRRGRGLHGTPAPGGAAGRAGAGLRRRGKTAAGLLHGGTPARPRTLPSLSGPGARAGSRCTCCTPTPARWSGSTRRWTRWQRAGSSAGCWCRSPKETAPARRVRR